MVAFRRFSIAVVVLVSLLCVVFSCRGSRERELWRHEVTRDCNEQGGVINFGRFDAFCIRDGLIVKVYRW